MGNNITKILPGLYIGSLEATKDDEELMANCISNILFVQDEKFDIDKCPGRSYLQLVINEEQEKRLLKHIPISNDFIHQTRVENGGVLVCSQSGISTNIALIAAYLMTIYDLNDDNALRIIKSYLPVACLTQNLKNQLKIFGRSSSTDSSSTSERERLFEKFGNWYYIEEDLSVLDALLQTSICCNHEDQDSMVHHQTTNGSVQNTASTRYEYGDLPDRQKSVDFDQLYQERKPDNTLPLLNLGAIEQNFANLTIHRPQTLLDVDDDGIGEDEEVDDDILISSPNPNNRFGRIDNDYCDERNMPDPENADADDDDIDIPGSVDIQFPSNWKPKSLSNRFSLQTFNDSYHGHPFSLPRQSVPVYGRSLQSDTIYHPSSGDDQQHNQFSFSNFNRQ